MQPTEPRPGLLGPYKVLDLADARGILAGHLFAQLGAEVLAIEPPGGSSARALPPFAAGESLFWGAYAAGKSSLVLDLNSASGQEKLRELAGQADFLIGCFAPAQMREMGLDYAELRRENPRLITVSITGFGESGPKADYQDSDLTVWAASGVLWPHRAQDGAPLRISVPQAFHHAAADALAGALVALYARHASGRGQHVSVSAQQSALLAGFSHQVAPAVGHVDYSTSGGGQGKIMAAAGLGLGPGAKWQVQDGLVEMNLGIGPISGVFANHFFAWAKEHHGFDADFANWDWRRLPAQLATGERSVDDLARARAGVAKLFSGFSKMQLFAAAGRYDLKLAPVMTAADLLQFAQLQERGYFVESGSHILPHAMGTACGIATSLSPAPALDADSNAWTAA